MSWDCQLPLPQNHVESKVPLWLILRRGHRIWHEQTLGIQTSRDMTNLFPSLISFNFIAYHKLRISNVHPLCLSSQCLHLETGLSNCPPSHPQKRGALSFQLRVLAFRKSSELPRRTRELKKCDGMDESQQRLVPPRKKAPSTPAERNSCGCGDHKIHQVPGANQSEGKQVLGKVCHHKTIYAKLQ